MNTLTRMALLHFFLTTTALLGALSANAHEAQLELSIEEAEEFTAATLSLMESAHMMGSFDRSSDAEAAFSEADRIAQDFLKNPSLSVEKIAVDEKGTVLSLLDNRTNATLQVRAVQEVRGAENKSSTAVGGARYILPGTHLIIEEATSFSDRNSGLFSSIIIRSTPDPEGSLRSETGIRKGPFTLSFFGMQSGEKSSVGINASYRVQLRNGWSVNVLAIATENLTEKTKIVEGRYQNQAARYPHGFMSFRLDRQWELTSLRSSAGVNLFWNGGNSFQAEPEIVAFVGVSQAIKNRGGKEIGAIEALVSRKFARNHSELFLGLQARFSF